MAPPQGLRAWLRPSPELCLWGEDCLSEASSAALTFGTGAKVPGGPRPGAHGFGSFCRNKRTSSCGAEPPQEALCHPRPDRGSRALLVFSVVGLASNAPCSIFSPCPPSVVVAASHAAFFQSPAILSFSVVGAASNAARPLRPRAIQWRYLPRNGHPKRNPRPAQSNPGKRTLRRLSRPINGCLRVHKRPSPRHWRYHSPPEYSMI